MAELRLLRHVALPGCSVSDLGHEVARELKMIRHGGDENVLGQ